MASLLNKTPAETYKDLLTVSSASSNQGLESSLKSVFDGEGVESAIQLSTTTLKIPSGKTLEIAGTLNSVNATLTGDLSVGDDLNVTDLITGNSMTITTHIGSATLTTSGMTTADSLRIGGGYGDTGLTVANTGALETNADIKVDGKMLVGTQFNIGGNNGTGYTGSVTSPTGLTIESTGRINTDEIIVCQAVKTTSGVVSSSANNSPKVKLDTATEVALTVDDSGTDKKILKVKEDGEATFKNKSGDTKFTVKNDGRLGFKQKTTTELNAISASAGDMAFDNTLGVFKVWRP
jgi:hypothetical protein